MKITAEDMETVAERADDLGYEGTDASPVISLAEYGFLARKGTPYLSNADDWDVLFHVPAGHPAGPGFAFGSFDGEECADRFDIGRRLHELRQDLYHEADNAGHTVKALRCYHDPDGEPKAAEARAVLQYRAETIRAHMSHNRPLGPHMTDLLYLAEYAGNHQDPVILLHEEKDSNAERRRKTARRLLHSIEDKWRKVVMQHGVCIPGEPVEEWKYSF